ncbi:MAG: polysaccharide deacetylase family protein [Bacillota bacterium]
MSRSERMRIAIVAVVLAVLAYLSVAGPRSGSPPAPTPPLSSQAGVSGLAGGRERETRVLGEFDLARLFPESVLRQGDVANKTIALTFDDVPDNQYTPQILDILAQKDVKATFFLIGKRVSELPEVTRRIVSEGHDVGNHTFSHPNVTQFSPDIVEKEVRAADRELERFGIRTGGMFRPPYGAVGPTSVEPLKNAGYRLYLWSVDSLDWRGLAGEQVVSNVIPQIANGAVVLFHSAGGPGEDLSGTVRALPSIIDDLRAKGFRFVTLREMFPPAVPR